MCCWVLGGGCWCNVCKIASRWSGRSRQRWGGGDLVNIITTRKNIWDNSLFPLTTTTTTTSIPDTTTPELNIGYHDGTSEHSPLPLLFLPCTETHKIWITEWNDISLYHCTYLVQKRNNSRMMMAQSLMNWFVATNHQMSDGWFIELWFARLEPYILLKFATYHKNNCLFWLIRNAWEAMSFIISNTQSTGTIICPVYTKCPNSWYDISRRCQPW